jgi:hypothetical protein
MAGGLFGQPFALNVKCVIFSLIIIGVFLVCPGTLLHKPYLLAVVLFVLFVMSYVALAWYDHYFNCKTLPLEKGKYSFTDVFKPPTNTYPQKDTKDKRRRTNTLIYVSHLLFIAPFIAYIAYAQETTKPQAYVLLGVLGVFTVFYHGIQLINTTKK